MCSSLPGPATQGQIHSWVRGEGGLIDCESRRRRVRKEGGGEEERGDSKEGREQTMHGLSKELKTEKAKKVGGCKNITISLIK